MALVLLKTGIHHPEPGTTDPATGEAAVPTVDAGQMATAQKLLLFWRKPAVSPRPRCNVGREADEAEEMLVGRYRGGRAQVEQQQGDDEGQSMGEAGMDIGVVFGESDDLQTAGRGDLLTDLDLGQFSVSVSHAVYQVSSSFV